MPNINVRVDHYVHIVEGDPSELKQLLINNQGLLLSIMTKLGQMAQQEAQMASDVNAAIDRLTNEVTGMENAEQGLLTAFNTLADEMRANAGDATAINALADRVEAKASEMAAAVLAGTSAGGGSAPAGGGTPPDGGTGEPTSRRR